MQRPSPEKLLQRAQSEEEKAKRGKLKIYLGAAPGVGKTHEMLHDAIEDRAKGLDVVIGIVESHGRREIESLLKDFEILPKQEINYRGRSLSEFDLDLALKRNPALILVDEMAHSNAPNLRHSKRWQDIKELLDCGIDVYTTLNVQHIESLIDDVTQIIYAPIKETVPDFMLEMADTIELIDIAPDDLLTRLKEGKIYFPEQAGIAANRYFRKGNLIALRELALRVTAERVGAEVLLYRQGEGIKHIWPTKDKILVCVGPNPESIKLIRAAKRMATHLHADWIAVYVDTPSLQSVEQNRNIAIQHLRFAEELGAEIRVLTGFDIVTEIMNYAREENVTQLMIWKHIRKRWRNLFFRNLADEIVRNSREIDVYIMTGETETPPKKSPFLKQTPWKIYGISLLIVAFATAINYFFFLYLSDSTLIMVYLLGVTIVALFGQVGPSLLASVLSVLIYAIFFGTFTISGIEYFFTLFVMLLVTQVISHFTILTRRQTKIAQLNENQISALYTLSRQLASARGVDKLIDIGTQNLSKILNSNIIALLPENSHFIIRSVDKTITELDSKELSIAQWVYDLKQMAGFGTDTLTFSDALYIPLIGSQRVMGVLRIQPKNKILFAPEQMRLLESCANQIALALEVDRMHEMTKKSELQEEIDRVRNALLESVSHDLRTPLLAAMSSANVLMEVGDTLNGEQVQGIGKDIYLGIGQLNRLINNLLQITYLEAESVKLQNEFASLQEIIDVATKMAESKLGKRSLRKHIPANLPQIRFDKTLMQEVLNNLVDNAIKFTADETDIKINIIVNIETDKVIVSVEDNGPGITQDEVDKLFEKFYRGRMLTTKTGLGLGLAICKKIIKAHGGEIWAENRKEGGAAFRFSLPLS